MIGTLPIPMLLHCPMCAERHIDKGEFKKKVHHTHACQYCGHVWRPCVLPTVGVRFLPGFKDAVKVKRKTYVATRVERLKVRSKKPLAYDVSSSFPASMASDSKNPTITPELVIGALDTYAEMFIPSLRHPLVAVWSSYNWELVKGWTLECGHPVVNPPNILGLLPRRVPCAQCAGK